MTSVEDEETLLGPKYNRLKITSTIWLGYGIKYLLTILVPVLLVLTVVRILMLPWFIQVEYQRPGFPDDVYGFTQEERMTYAPVVLEYLFNSEEISFLDNLTFDDGTPLFNERELHHMVDVKVVTRQTFRVLYSGWIVIAAMLIVTYKYPYLRQFAKEGITQGSLLTLGTIGAIIVVIGVTWDTFFTSFHDLFFASGTWRFAFSDTLIRLFPEQFWVDASLIVGGVSILLSLSLILLMWNWRIE